MCEYSGCNAPEGECLGECLPKKVSIVDMQEEIERLKALVESKDQIIKSLLSCIDFQLPIVNQLKVDKVDFRGMHWFDGSDETR